jgi:hypothetical protein
LTVAVLGQLITPVKLPKLLLEEVNRTLGVRPASGQRSVVRT